MERSSGQNLEYSAEFVELEEIVNAGGGVEYGDFIYSPGPVDWVRVESLCRELCKSTLDLRIVVLLTRALLERYGLVGFIGGLRLVAWLLRQRWDSVHPQLSVEDQFDPLIRINALAELAVPATIVVALKRQVLAITEDGEALRLEDLETICVGEDREKGERREVLCKLINPNCSAGLMRGLAQMKAIYSELNEINLCLEEVAAVDGVSPLQDVSNMLRKWVCVVEDQLRNVSSERLVSTPLQSGVLAQSRPVNSVCEANFCESREDVVRALDAICSYYQQHEPSSPVPFLLARVRRLTSMSFINVIAELAPDALADLRRLGESSTD